MVVFTGFQKFELANFLEFCYYAPMYYQPDLTYSNRLFKAFLLLSVVLHGGILFYKKSRSTFFVSGQESFPMAQSIQVHLQEAFKPQPKRAPKKIEKKKVIRENIAKTAPITPSKPQEENSSAPAAKNFESVVKSYVEPHYPRIALRRGITGKVSLTLWVKGTGEIDKVLVSESSGYQSLDNSALLAAKSWSFKRLSDNSNSLYKLSKVIVYKIN